MVDYFDTKEKLLSEIKKHGGWVNAHAHIDRAYTLTDENFHLTNSKLQEKWELVDTIKRTLTVDDIYDRMARALEHMISQGVQAIGSFIDVDEVIEDRAIRAATKVREQYKNDIQIKFINQVLKGVIDPKSRKWFEEGAQFVDIIGGLPGKDNGKEEDHLDVLFETAKKMGKMIHVHVDQLNSAKEKETELLVKKTIEYEMQGKVVAVHGVSIAAHTKEYRESLYKKMKEARVMLVCCPSAWIDSRRSEEISVTHNSIAPVDELVPAAITVALGTDNIADIYKPFSDGDMHTELRILLESCHFYDVENLVKIATENGLKTLGLSS